MCAARQDSEALESAATEIANEGRLFQDSTFDRTLRVSTLPSTAKGWFRSRFCRLRTGNTAFRFGDVRAYLKNAEFPKEATPCESGRHIANTQSNSEIRRVDPAKQETCRTNKAADTNTPRTAYEDGAYHHLKPRCDPPRPSPTFDHGYSGRASLRFLSVSGS